MKFKFYLLFFVSFAFCKKELDLPTKALLNDNHVFALVCQDEDGSGYTCAFEIGGLLKSKFPQGPLRYNKVAEKKMLNAIQIKNMELNSWELSMLCVEDKSMQGKIKCGFESLENHNLAYVFSLPHEIKHVRGFVILRTLYTSIIDGNNDFSVSTRVIKEEQIEQIDPIDVGEEEELWDDEPPALVREEPKGILEKLYFHISHIRIVQRSMLWLLLKYVDAKKYFSNLG